MGNTLQDPGHEHALAERVAWIKAWLALATTILILVDRANLGLGSGEMAAVVVFLACMIGSWALIRSGFTRSESAQLLTPVIDAIAVSVLLSGTGGSGSPALFWIAIITVCNALLYSWVMPTIAGAGAIGCLITASLTEGALTDVGVLLIRAIQIIGVAALSGYVAHQYRHRAGALEAIDQFGRSVESLADVGAANALFEAAACQLLGADKARLDTASSIPFGPNEVLLAHGSGIVGVCEIYRKRPPDTQERRLLGLLADRLAWAHKSLILRQDLVRSTANDERQRYADELHDTHLQTLAAVDLQVELAVRKTTDESIIPELKEIKLAVREAAQRTRAFIGSVGDHPPLGPDSIRELTEDRWPGAVVHIQEHVELTEGQWSAITMLCQEGINNAKTHGRSSHIWLTVVQYGPETVVRLEADGRSPVDNSRPGYGLRRLETIVNANHGELTLEAGPAGGSCLRATFLGSTS